MELCASLAPVAALPFAQRAGHVAVSVGVLVQAQRQLPTDVRFPVERTFPDGQGSRMQRASFAAGETRPVEEDARAVVDARDDRAVGLGVRPTVSGALAVELPLGRSQAGGAVDNCLHVGGVDEVRAIATATLIERRGVFGEHPLAAIAPDAVPVRAKEGDIEDPRPFFFGIVEADVLVQIVGAGHLDERSGKPIESSRPHR